MAIKLKNFQIYPSSSSTKDEEFCTPLTHFDIPFLQSDPTQRLIFFDFRCSEPHFHENILPSLKNSLSLTLTHFLPLAGKIFLPLDSGSPIIRYATGDSVSLTVAQSNQDIHYLMSNDQRVADEFYGCVPELPPATRCAGPLVSPAIALQVTLFPSQGVCIGITNHHAVSDESGNYNFVKTWAYANRLGEAFHRTDCVHMPVLDRTLVEDREGLASIAWKFVRNRKLPFELPPAVEFPINRVRSTFLLTKDKIQKLKNDVSAAMPEVPAVSTFTVISAYAWICSERAEAAADKKNNNDNDKDDDEAVYFCFAADCRGRLNPPLPESYFGNCLVIVVAESRRGLLKKEDGFLTAVESITKAIRRTLHSDRGVLGAASWPLDFQKFGGKSMIAVAGSPRFDVYEADFGWGRAKKQEFVHLDRERSISIFKSRDFEGGFEIGVSRRKVEMDCFQDVFVRGLEP